MYKMRNFFDEGISEKKHFGSKIWKFEFSLFFTLRHGTTIHSHFQGKNW